MAHAPALLRTNTAPVFPANSNYGGTTSSSMSSFRVSHLSGATAVNSASTTSLSSMSSANTMIPSANGVMATANIINQRADASRSLYQICMALKQRLAQVPDFQGYLQILDDDAIRSSNNYDPVESLWKLFRTGDPLLTIYNSIKPDIPLNPADLPMDPARRPKAATFQFINACLKQLQIPAGDCFIVSDLMNTDTTGFMKVRLSPSTVAYGVSCLPATNTPIVGAAQSYMQSGHPSHQPCTRPGRATRLPYSTSALSRR